MTTKVNVVIAFHDDDLAIVTQAAKVAGISRRKYIARSATQAARGEPDALHAILDLLRTRPAAPAATDGPGELAVLALQKLGIKEPEARKRVSAAMEADPQASLEALIVAALKGA